MDIRENKKKVKISYTVYLTPYEYKELAKLGREWGYTDKSDLQIIKHALYNSGVSGCLSQIPLEDTKAINLVELSKIRKK